MLDLSRLRRALMAIEPWYDLRDCDVSRLDAQCRHFTDEAVGYVRRLEVQWLGIHFAIELGRTPSKVSPEESAERRARYAALTQGGHADA